jgi:hypothetical protein
MRRIFGIERLIVNNEIAGFKFAVVGVIYGLLLTRIHRMTHQFAVQCPRFSYSNQDVMLI